MRILILSLDTCCRYDINVDWRDPSNWSCNDNVHPSRHGAYDGISMHPFETLFVKESWHVGEPHLSRYTKWKREHFNGRPGTGGVFNRDLYLYGITKDGRYPTIPPDIFEAKNVPHIPEPRAFADSDKPLR